MRSGRKPNRTTTLAKVAVTGALVTASVMAALTPAFAYEGSWSSYVSGGRPGFTSRTWADNDTTTNGTVVWQAACSPSGTNPAASTVVWRLTKLTVLVENRGQASYSCSGYREFTYARQPAGNYRIELVTVDGDTAAWRTINTPNPNGIGVKY